jgi:hypothetical protein
MKVRATVSFLGCHALRGSIGALSASMMMVMGCGSTVTSGVAVGKVGHHLSAHSQSVPQGAQVCAIQEALAAPPPGGAPDKPSTACAKAQKSDRLWRRAIVVLAAYGESLETMGSGKDAENAGQLEAALTGVQGGDWVDVDDAGEKASRDAVTQLVTQMGANASKGDLAKTVGSAAPQVKTVCDGLAAYLEAQTKSLGDVQKEAEKKRASKTERRCGALDNRPLCVSETSIDRVVYASASGDLAMMETNHADARDAVASFCAAHRKLEEAAAGGRLSKNTTYGEIVEAVKASRKK